VAGCGGGSSEEAARVVHLADLLPREDLAIPDEAFEETLSIDFDGPGDLDRVVDSSGIEDIRLGERGLLFRTTEHRSWIDLRLDVDAASASVLLVRIRRSEGHIRPYAGWFGAPGADGAAPTERLKVQMRILERDDPYLVCWIPLEDYAPWTGRIERLRLYPTNLPRCEVEIDRIGLVRASVLARWRNFENQSLVRGKVSIAKEMREALLAPPPARFAQELLLPESAQMTVGYAVLAAGWRAEGGSAVFRVRVREGSRSPRTVFERRIDPRTNPAERRWHDARIDLSAYAGRRVSVILETEGESEDSGRYVPAVWSDPVVFRPGRHPGERNLVLVSLDTLRADRLGAHGYPRSTSPNLDRFSRQSFHLEDLVSQAASTGPSHMSLFLSLYPTAHGITNHDARLPEEAVTLAEILRDAGFATGAFTEGGYIAGSIGFHQGFTVYGEVGGQNDEVGGFVEETFERGLDWLGRNRDRRCFLFLQTYETHVPYCPGSPYDRLFDPDYAGALDPCLSYKETKEINYECLGLNPDDPANHGRRPATPDDLSYVEALYDGEIRRTDAAVRRVLEEIAALDLERDTVVVFFSDHGEDFGDHLAVARHGRSLYGEMLHVPMMLRIPGFDSPPRRIADSIAMVDVMPTLLELLRIRSEAEGAFEGRSFVPLLRGESSETGRTLFAENYSIANRAMVREGRYKLVETREFTRDDIDRLDPTSVRIRGLRLGDELYDLEADPGERVDVASDLPDVHRRLKEKLRAFLEEQERKRFRRETQEIDEGDRKRLKELGYLDE
jgi:arylsulfatase A-like enzyme